MRVLQVTLGFGANSGGPARSTAGLAKGLAQLDGVEVFLFNHNLSESMDLDLTGVRVIDGSWNGSWRESSRQFEQAMLRVAPDVVHFHGIWHPILHFNCVACRRHKVPYVIAPRGALDEWSMRQKTWKKKLALWLYQWRDLSKAAALHVTAQMEAEHCRKLGYKGRFILSPNGVNLPKGDLVPARGRHGNHRMLFLSRMHPKKGVLELVEAWARVQVDMATNGGGGEWLCELVYTVFDPIERQYEARVRQRIEELGLADRFVFTGAMTNEAKWTAYMRADGFVLPSHTENFGIVIAEALYAGVPVITTKNTPWRRLEEAKAGWWIDLSVENLARALEELMNMSDIDRTAMGARGRELVIREYSWESACKAMVAGYSELLK